MKARILVLGAAAAALGCNAKSTGLHPGISNTAYSNGNAGSLASLTVTAANNQSWAASVTGSAAPSGSYSLLFSTVVNNVSTQNGKGYSAEGTLTATLPAVTASGATGTVTLNATF